MKTPQGSCYISRTGLEGGESDGQNSDGILKRIPCSHVAWTQEPVEEASSSPTSSTTASLVSSFEASSEGSDSKDFIPHCLIDRKKKNTTSSNATEDTLLASACISELLSVLGVAELTSTHTETLRHEIPQIQEGQFVDSSSISNTPLLDSEVILPTFLKPRSTPMMRLSVLSMDIPRRRSLFDLARYTPKEPAELAGDGMSVSMGGIRKTNSASSMSGFYPRPEPGKSLLKRECSSSSVGGVGLKRSNSSTVSFSNLEIREYNVALSDHPDCSYGPPIQLGWSYSKKCDVSVDDYEQSTSKRNKRTGRDLLLSSPERRELLLEEGGYSKEELLWAFQEVERVKLERRLSESFSKARQTTRSRSNSTNMVEEWLSSLRSWIS